MHYYNTFSGVTGNCNQLHLKSNLDQHWSYQSFQNHLEVSRGSVHVNNRPLPSSTQITVKLPSITLFSFQNTQHTFCHPDTRSLRSSHISFIGCWLTAVSFLPGRVESQSPPAGCATASGPQTAQPGPPSGQRCQSSPAPMPPPPR